LIFILFFDWVKLHQIGIVHLLGLCC